ncbi:MAG: hypothetical protein WAV07_01990 [Candidatus Contendobacter sp.]
MAPASEALFDSDDTEFHAALIGLGRRGCEYVQRLRRAGLADAHAFLIDHDSESRREDAPPDNTYWIGNAEIVPDFSACGLLGVVIVGAEHRDKSEQLSLKLGLLKERPTLLLGMVLPPPAGERNPLRPELLRELDGVAYWPGDPARPELWALLQAAVDDLVGAVSAPGPVEADLAELITVFGGARSILIASAALERPADPERMLAVAYTALAELYDRGFKPDQATGMLVMVRGAGVEACEAVRRLFRDILPDAAPTALAAPAGEGWRERTRVSLFAVGPFGGVGR